MLTSIVAVILLVPPFLAVALLAAVGLHIAWCVAVGVAVFVYILHSLVGGPA